MADKTKDTRVVEMQFDSRDFDKNIRKSQKTLEDFKESLNFDDAVGQMQQLDTSSNTILEGMAKNVKKLTSELAGIGNIGTFVAKKFKNAWQGTINSVESFTKSLTTAQIDEGAKKYEKLTKSVMTIKNATNETEEAVYQVLGDLNKYTDETSYSFSEMVSTIGKFTTAGVGLKDAEQELEGVANWAALAGQGINEANQAMYNIAQAMSAGYMLKIDYKSIQNANMDIRAFREQALLAAEEVGTLVKKGDKYYTKKGHKEVNLDNFAETLQYKWFDRATMEKVFKTFGDQSTEIGEKAYKAAQRCTSLSDALNAIKDMLSTGWMTTYQHIFGKLSEAIDLFTGMCNKAEEALAKFMDARNAILENWNLAGGRNSLWGMLVGEIESPDGGTLFKGAYGLLDIVTDISDAFRDAFRDLFMMFLPEEQQAEYMRDPDKIFAHIGIALSKFTEQVQKSVSSIHNFLYSIPEGAAETRMDRIRNVIQGIYSAIILVVQVVKGIGTFIGEILGQLTPTFDALGGTVSLLMQLFTGRVVESAKNNEIGNFFHNLADLLRPVTSVLNVIIVVLTKVINAVAMFLDQTGLIPTVLGWIQNAVGFVGDAFARLLTSDGFAGFIRWLQNLSANIPGVVQKLKTFGSAMLQTAKSSKVFKTISGWVEKTFGGKTIGDVWTNIKGRFSQLTTLLPTLLPTIKEGLKGVLSDIGTALDNFFGNILDFFVSTAKAEDASENVTGAIVEAVVPKDASGTDLIGQIKSKLSEFFDPIKNAFTTFFKETIPNFFNSDAMKGIGKFFEGTNFQNLMGGVTNLVKWLAIFRSGSGLVSAGKGIKKLGTGLKVFGKNLKNLNLADAFKNMFSFTNIVNSNNTDNSKTTTLGNFGNNLLKAAIGIGVVIFAAIKLSETLNKMTPDQMKNTGIALGALLSALVLADIVTKKWGGGGDGLMKLAIGVALMLVPLQKLMNMSWNSVNGKSGFWDGFGKLVLMLVAVAGAARLAGGKGAKGLIGMAVGINLLLRPLKQLMGMKLYTLTDKGVWDPNGGGLIQAIVALAAIMAMMGVAAKLGGDEKIKGILSFAIALNLLMLPLKDLAAMNLQQYLQALFGVGTIIGLLCFLAYEAKDAKLASLAGVVGAVAALSFIGTLISALGWKGVLTGFGPIVVLLGEMIYLVAVAKEIDTANIKALKGIFTTFAFVVGVMALGLIAIHELGVPETTILEFFGGIIATLLMLDIAIGASKGMTKQSMGGMAIAFGMMALVIGELVGGLILVQNSGIGWEKMVAMMGGIVAVILVAGLMMKLCSHLTVTGALIAVFAIAGVVAAVMGVIGLLADYLLGSVGNALGQISGRLKTTSGLLKDFFDRMGTITEDSVNRAIQIFDSLQSIVKKFIGFAAYTSGVNSLEVQLSKLGNGLDLFFLNESKYPSPDESKGIALLNKFIDIAPSLRTFNVGNLPDQVFMLGVALGLFNTATSGITEENPKALSLLNGLFGQADNIEKFTKLPLDTLTVKMTDLGGAMSLYAKGASEVTGVNEEGVVSIADAVGILNQITGAINEEGGLKDFTIPNLPEENETSSFGAKLAALAMALGEFIDAGSNYTGTTQQAVDALGTISDINSKLTEDKLQFVNVLGKDGITEDMLGEFALNIAALGTALHAFATNVNDADFSSGLKALNKLESINNKLTTDKLSFLTAFDDIFGETLSGEDLIAKTIEMDPMTTFANNIGELGRALGSFAQNLIMDSGEYANFDEAIKALEFMGNLQVTLSSELPKIGGIHTLWDGQAQTIGTLSGDVEEIGQALSDFSDKMSGIGEDSSIFNYDAVMNGLDTIERLVNIANSLSVYNPSTGNIFSAGTMVKALSELASGLNSDEFLVFDTNGETFFTNIAAFTKNLGDAMKNAGEINSEGIQTFATMAAGITDMMSLDPSLSFEYPGKMIAAGIADGIRAGQIDVENAIRDVVQAAINTFNTETETGSPSKLFARLGGYLDAGLEIGLRDGRDGIEDETINTVSAMQQIMNEAGMDLNPTITPVLDLSSVRAGTSQISGWLGSSRQMALDLTSSIGLAAAAAKSSGPVEVIVQNPLDLSGVYGAIDQMESSIIDLGDRIRSMRVVLDTGVIAGGVTDEIDLNLGRKGLYASRRN